MREAKLEVVVPEHEHPALAYGAKLTTEPQKAVLWALWLMAGHAMGYGVHDAQLYAQDQWDRFCLQKYQVRRYEGPDGPRAYIIEQAEK